MYAVSGIMQAILLVMCLFWKARQRRLNIDDFGHPLDPAAHIYNGEGESVEVSVPDDVEEDVRDGSDTDLERRARIVLGEETPLMGGRKKKGGVLGWMRR